MKTHVSSPASSIQRACSLTFRLERHARLWSALGFAALALVAQPVRPTVTEAWVQRYSNINSNSDDQAFKITRDAAGDVIVAGTTADGTGGPDMLTIKYSGTNGAVLWRRRYTGPTNDSYFESFPSAVAVDASGNVIVTGGAGYPDNDGEDDYDYYTAKYAAADGALLWEKRYNGSGYFSDVPSAVAVDGSGNVIVTGYSKDSYSFFSADYYTAKYAAADGALLWEKRYSLGRDVPHAIAVDSAGNVVVTGESDGGTSYFDYYTVKYAAANGAVLWEKRYSSAEGVYDAPTRSPWMRAATSR